MIRNYIYYCLKPLLPQPLRFAIRRWFAARKRDLVRDVWPIMPGSEKPPVHWTGWPNGKKFAFVITHDVESAHGLNKCTALMELEKAAGFRASFNFIPEGNYSTPKELRELLERNGFEVGVHDLKHDGMLYLSRNRFRRFAKEINHYLKDWNAVGFRSGFMHHNLNWVHDLNISYDASTFDTDPFEPQPEGLHTIFPMWIENNDGSGYVELPYTLPQDSTLFNLLQETSIDIWKTKFDWVVKNGGMALINIHPDYHWFDPQDRRPYEYPVTFYKEFLGWVKEKYSEQYWHALPREVAEFYRSTVHANQARGSAPDAGHTVPPTDWNPSQDDRN